MVEASQRARELGKLHYVQWNNCLFFSATSFDPEMSCQQLIIESLETSRVTSKNDCMKFWGSFAVLSSTGLKYLRTWESCFQ